MIGRFWDLITRKPSDAALRGATKDQGGIYDGTVGWNDGSAHFDLDADSGVTLVRVTLFKGRNPDQDQDPITDKLAHGHEILCRIGAPLYFVPPKGSQVMVAMAADRGLTPGAGVIFSMPIASPGTQFNDKKAKMDFGPDVELVIKAGSVTLSDYEDRFYTLGPKFGIKCGDRTGSGFHIKDSKLLLYASVTKGDGSKGGVCSLEMSENKLFGLCNPAEGGTPSGFKFALGSCHVYCKEYSNNAASGQLGGTASPISGIQYGPGIGVPSMSWKVSS